MHRKMNNFSAMPWREQVTFYKMMMTVSALYKANTLSWIFIELAHF